MILEVGVPVTVLDLATSVKGDSGTFICQNGGQNYVLEAKAGHSITFGPYPFGRKIFEALNTSNLNAEPWTVTKLSSGHISNEFLAGGGSIGNLGSSRRREMAE